MTRRYTSEIINEIGPEKDIPAPDVGTSPREMAWIFDTYSMNKGHSVLGVVTGKPLTVGGSLGRLEATARGGALLHARRDGAARDAARGQTVVVQGFGNVGSYYALFMQQEGAKVIAISDSGGGVYNPKGIDIASAIAHKQERGTLQGLAGVEAISNEELLLLDCDILAPCGLEQVITEENADKIKAKIVCEGANGPTTPAADEILEEKGVLVLPDVLANAGGVVVSYFEWVQGLQEYFWKEDEVNAKLKEIVDKAFEETWHVHEARDVSMRLAAYGLAVQRVAEATMTRGLYPVTASPSTTPTAATSASVRGARSQSFGSEHEFELERGRHRRRPRARGALPRVAPGGRDRRRAGLRLLPGQPPRSSARLGAQSQAVTNDRRMERSALAQCSRCYKQRHKE